MAMEASCLFFLAQTWLKFENTTFVIAAASPIVLTFEEDCLGLWTDSAGEPSRSQVCHDYTCHNQRFYVVIIFLICGFLLLPSISSCLKHKFLKKIIVQSLNQIFHCSYNL